MSNAVTSLAVNARTDTAYMFPLWEAVERLIGLWAYRYMRTTETRLYDENDLLQSGYLALADAVKSYDPSAGTEFTTYLNYHIRRRFAEVSGHRGTKQRPEVFATSLDVPLADESDTTKADMIPDPSAEAEIDNVIEQLHSKHLHAVLDECMATITPEHADTLRALYYAEQTRAEVAEANGTNTATIRHMEQKGLAAMRRGKNAVRLREYREFVISRQYYFSGFHSFVHSQSSCVERTVEKLLEFEAQEVTT